MVNPTPVSAATQAPPELISEHGRGQVTVPKKTVTVKSHTRQVTDKSKAKAPPVDPITAQVNAAQLPQLQAIQAAQAASTLAAKNASTTTSGYYGALGELLKGGAPQVQQTYQSAAGDTAAFGKGFSDGLSHVQSQTQGEQANLAGISGGAAPPPVSPAASNALYNMGGYIPAAGLEREGAAFASAAAGLPGAALGQGAGALAKIAGDEQTAQQGFGTKFTDLAAQVPGLRLQFQTHADTVAAAAATQAAHERDVKRQQAISYILATGVGPDGKLTPRAQAELARATGYMQDGTPTASTTAAAGRLAVAKVNANTALARLDLATQKALSDMYGVDANGNQTLPGKRAALAQWKATHPAAKGGLTAKAKAGLQNQAANLADLYYYGKPNKVNGQDVPGSGIHSIADYQEALKLTMSHGIPLTYAQKALDALYPIGVDGRPWVPIQARFALEKAGAPLADPFSKPTEEQARWLNANGFPYNGDIAPHSDTGFRGGTIPKK